LPRAGRNETLSLALSTSTTETTMHTFLQSLLGAVLLVATMSKAAAGIVWNEQADAGHLVNTSQQTVGIGPLTQINGSLGFNSSLGFDVDMFCISIEDTAAFTATVVIGNGSPFGAAILILWLFDDSGHGITSQEGFYLNTPTKITGAHVPAPGRYHLAISQHDVLPYSPGGQIWSVAPRSIETPPNGLSTGPLTTWRAVGTGIGVGAYSISLTGTQACCQEVPVPGTLPLVGCALALLGFALTSQRRRAAF
jgi:hypothetical protein